IISGTQTVLHHFNISIGINPYGSLVQASDGKLYGMTRQGGSNGFGTLFSFDASLATHSVFHHFNISNGAFPSGSLTQASDGKLYGMTQGGSNGLGTLFSFDASLATHSVLHHFNSANG